MTIGQKIVKLRTASEISQEQLAEMVKETVGFEGRIEWNAEKPDGTMRKLCDVSKIHSLGWHHTVELADGVKMLYDWYLNAERPASR